MTTYRANEDLELYQGADFEMAVTVLDDNQSPMDLTGYGAMMEIRPDIKGEVLLSASTTDGKITINGTEGKVGITISYTDTITLPAGTFRYDIFIQSPGAATRRCIAYGNIKVVPKITEVTL